MVSVYFEICCKMNCEKYQWMSKAKLGEIAIEIEVEGFLEESCWYSNATIALCAGRMGKFGSFWRERKEPRGGDA